ncbi:MAG: hypothetical protein WBO46_01225, partial [Caldilineaceae bacterium]
MDTNVPVILQRIFLPGEPTATDSVPLRSASDGRVPLSFFWMIRRSSIRPPEMPAGMMLPPG